MLSALISSPSARMQTDRSSSYASGCGGVEEGAVAGPEKEPQRSPRVAAKTVQLPPVQALSTEHPIASKWDRLNYLRGKIEGSGAAQRKKHVVIEKYAIFCTIETVDGSTIGSGSALLEPSLSALINRQRKRSVGPREAPTAVASMDRTEPLKNSPPQKSKSSPQIKHELCPHVASAVVASAIAPSATSGLIPNKSNFRGSPPSLHVKRSTPQTSPGSWSLSDTGFKNFPSAPVVQSPSAQPPREKSPVLKGQEKETLNFNYLYTFFLLPKSIVRKDNIPSKQMMVMPLCPTEVSASAFNTLGFCAKSQCEYGHLLAGSRNELVNLSDKKIVQNVVGNITVRDGGAVFDLAPSEVGEMTAGFLFACYLLNKDRKEDLQELGAVSHDICPRYKKHQQCDFGPRCLRIHSRKRVVDKGPIDSSTPLKEILLAGTMTPAASPNSDDGGRHLNATYPQSPCHPQHVSEEELVQTFMLDSGLKTVGDLCRLSEETYGFLIARYEKRPELAPILSRAGALWRCEDRSRPVELAVMCFPGVTKEDADTIPSCFSTVGQLVDSKAKELAQDVPNMNLLEACLQIRARNRDDDGPLYKQIALTDLPKNAFLVRMTEEVCKFRVNAHKSWRKQDATRPIVTSLFTYVDPEKCNCKATNTGVSSSFAVSSPADNHAPTATPGGGTHANRNTAENCSTTDYPWATHWCKCPRLYERAVNYELSTPSGSRCSEQNCLGMLASKMVPTDAIREVFVHGSHHGGEDPNPLFPCGVCENMLRRVAKDVLKKTGGQLLIFMFSAVESPRKLVWMPVTEMSHREGSVFRRFLEEEVR